MEDNIIEETVEFSEELYQKNLQENEFSEKDEFEGEGVENANN